MPVTVPKSPIIGAIFEMVVIVRIPFSSFATSRAPSSSIARMTSPRPRRWFFRPALMILEIGLFVCSQYSSASCSELREKYSLICAMNLPTSVLTRHRYISRSIEIATIVIESSSSGYIANPPLRNMSNMRAIPP